jgi:hypothetical protein
MSEQEKLKEGDVQTRIRRGTFTPHGLGHGVSVQDVDVVAHDKNLEVAFVAAEINASFRQLARSAHPDAGGTVDRMAELNAARDAGIKARG